MIDVDFYQRNGYLVINNFLSDLQCDKLMKRAEELIATHWSEDNKVIFLTRNDSHAQHRYFLDSGNKIRLFFEEGAFDSAGKLKYAPKIAINKIGHALHHLDEIFSSFSYSSPIVNLANQLGITDPTILQSMYICKQPYIGGEVKCHQDSTYLYVKEQPTTGFWFALEDATLDNGCLWAIPGGHHGALKSRMIRQPDDQVRTEVYDSTPFDTDKAIPLPVPRGSLIILHGLLPHMSKENTSGYSRHAYTLHMMSSSHEFPSDNWLRR